MKLFFEKDLASQRVEWVGQGGGNSGFLRRSKQESFASARFEG